VSLLSRSPGKGVSVSEIWSKNWRWKREKKECKGVHWMYVHTALSWEHGEKQRKSSRMEKASKRGFCMPGDVYSVHCIHLQGSSVVREGNTRKGDPPKQLPAMPGKRMS